MGHPFGSYRFRIRLKGKSWVRCRILARSLRKGGIPLTLLTAPFFSSSLRRWKDPPFRTGTRQDLLPQGLKGWGHQPIFFGIAPSGRPPSYAVAGIFTFSALDSRIRSFSLELSVGFASSNGGEEHHNSECA